MVEETDWSAIYQKMDAVKMELINLEKQFPEQRTSEQEKCYWMLLACLRALDKLDEESYRS